MRRKVRTTSSVHLEMDSSLREDSRHSGLEFICDESGSIFDKKARLQRAVDGEVDFGSSRVRVRGVETAWPRVRVNKVECL